MAGHIQDRWCKIKVGSDGKTCKVKDRAVQLGHAVPPSVRRPGRHGEVEELS